MLVSPVYCFSAVLQKLDACYGVPRLSAAVHLQRGTVANISLAMSTNIN